MTTFLLARRSLLNKALFNLRGCSSTTPSETTGATGASASPWLLSSLSRWLIGGETASGTSAAPTSAAGRGVADPACGGAQPRTGRRRRTGAAGGNAGIGGAMYCRFNAFMRARFSPALPSTRHSETLPTCSETLPSPPKAAAAAGFPLIRTRLHASTWMWPSTANAWSLDFGRVAGGTAWSKNVLEPTRNGEVYVGPAWR
mmetsp:Transcript_122458/g.341640  ORF Transcript_122458/g.341640 Transcript_122458/m.341640 type:complete len:201 (-) Transcript_122458:81-683(-)